ncbi:hypothetical protein Pcinc_039320 [Petrolisthes cinctipes]|uniref:Uncharacterized protein n=1 Tax=Petrolisthes cinctipes TaxID=88211 RepID=A0AAE1EJC8_PETCI|nr:hypothetical protein Pcinc_039320 [Petrolisthes cinctipes]
MCHITQPKDAGAIEGSWKISRNLTRAYYLVQFLGIMNYYELTTVYYCEVSPSGETFREAAVIGMLEQSILSLQQSSLALSVSFGNSTTFLQPPAVFSAPAGWLPVAAPRGWVEDTLMIAQILRFRLQHPVKMRAAGMARIDGAQYPVGEGTGKEPSQE